jgi:hypothetical protein
LALFANTAVAAGYAESYIPYRSEGAPYPPGAGNFASSPHSTTYYNSISARSRNNRVGIHENRVGKSGRHYTIRGYGFVNNRHPKWKSHAVCGNSDEKTIRIVQCHTAWSASRRSATAAPPEVECTLADAQQWADQSDGENGTALPPTDEPVDGSPPVIGLVGPPEADPVAMYEDLYRPINIWCYIPPDLAPTGVGAFRLADGTPCIAFVAAAGDIASCGSPAAFTDLTTLVYSDERGVYDVYGLTRAGTQSVRLGTHEAELTGRGYVVRGVDRKTARRVPVATLSSGQRVVLPAAPRGEVIE